MKKRNSKWRWRLLLFPIVLLLGITLPFRWLPPPTTAFMLQAQTGGLGDQPPCEKVLHRWIAWERIAPNAALAVVAAEDQLFPDHWGFDLNAISAALGERRSQGRQRGASTISQQLVKNLYLWPGYSWIRKGLEAGLTLLVETSWPKRRILEVYLNSVQFGACTFGIEAAAQQFFSKSASNLTAREAAFLASALPNPVSYRVDRPTPYMKQRVKWILGQMEALGGTAYLRGI